MPPPKGARRCAVSFHSIPETEFTKFLDVFAVHGVRYPRLTLRSGQVIRRGYCVQIGQGEDCSGTSAPHEAWVAQVLDIKADNDRASLKDLFVRIQWFYTRFNLANYPITVGNITSCRLGKRELVLSNHEQIIRADAILRTVVVHFFDEDNPTPSCGIIGSKDRWYRYHFQVGPGATANRIVHNSGKTLPVAGCAVPGCRSRYDPEEERQRFCPRSACEQWYHEVCLGNVGFVNNPRALMLERMLSGTPGFDDDGLDLGRLRTIERTMHRVLDEDDNNPLPTELLNREDEWRMIQKLIWCASTPIIRGLEYGITGTGCLVQDARAIVEEMMRHEGYWPNEDVVRPFAECEWPGIHSFKCNRCGGFI